MLYKIDKLLSYINITILYFYKYTTFLSHYQVLFVKYLYFKLFELDFYLFVLQLESNV